MSYTNRHAADFEVLRLRGWKLRISRRFPSHAIALPQVRDGHNGVRGPFERISSSRYSRVYRCRIGFFGTVHNLYLKQYLHRSVWDVLKHLFRPSRAQRAFKASRMLAKNGLLSPEVIAVGELKYGLACARTFLITREVAGAHSVPELLGDFARRPDKTRAKRDLIAAFGETVGRMHAAGIFHGDLRPGNVFGEDTAEGWRFFLLDNERTRKFRRLPHRLIVKNLVQIGMLSNQLLATTDRMRFLKSYLARNTRLGTDYRKLAAKVFSKTQARMAGKKFFNDFTQQ